MNTEIPQHISQYLSDNNFTLMTYANMCAVHKVHCALLTKNDVHRGKDFTFQFTESTVYDLFIVNTQNTNYLKPLGKQQVSSSLGTKYNSNYLPFNFDYNRNALYVVIGNVNDGRFVEYHRSPLNREVYQVSHSTEEGLSYFKETKSIKYPINSVVNAVDSAYYTFDKFQLMLSKYYMIEIERKKPLAETNMKEDGILSVLYILSRNREAISQVFTMVKYTLYFKKETLENYIGKYIRDVVFEFCHFPSDTLCDFLSHICAVFKRKGEDEVCGDGSSKIKSFVFPLKTYVNEVEKLCERNLLRHVMSSFSSIRRDKAVDKIPFHKFIQLIEKYNLVNVEDLRVKKKDGKVYELSKKYMPQSSVHSNVRASTNANANANANVPAPKKENKMNYVCMLKELFALLTTFMDDFFICNGSDSSSTATYADVDRFMLDSISKFIISYVAYKGFFNVEIVMNEDSVFDFHCFKDKKSNEKLNKKLFGCVTCVMGLLNMVFDFNEGFFHKHFSIMDYSYNFNEKNVIHTFPCAFDSSKKNRVRIFDVPFNMKWSYAIASVVLYVYKHFFGFMRKENINIIADDVDDSSNTVNSVNSIEQHFLESFNALTTLITTEFFNAYEHVLPDYYYLCTRMARYPLDKYNCLDNLCQHFTNNSVQCLLRKNIMFFVPYEQLYHTSKLRCFRRPRLTHLLEPYMILVDPQLNTYLSCKDKKEGHLRATQMTIERYFNTLKHINKQMVNVSAFLYEDKAMEYVDRLNNRMSVMKVKTISEAKVEHSEYDFYYVYNLSYHFTFKTMQLMKKRFYDYDVLKRYVASVNSSVTISFQDTNQTVLGSGPRIIQNIKVNKKQIKEDIRKDLRVIREIQMNTRSMCLIFYSHVKDVVGEIVKQQQHSDIDNNNNNASCCCYMKVGHYLVNVNVFADATANDVVLFMESPFYLNVMNTHINNK